MSEAHASTGQAKTKQNSKQKQHMFSNSKPTLEWTLTRESHIRKGNSRAQRGMGWEKDPVAISQRV